MSTTGATILVVILIVAVVCVAWSLRMRRRLKAKFAPAADAPADGEGDIPPRTAARDGRPVTVPIVPFRTADRDRFRREWDRVQAAFAEDPSDALIAADALVTRMMRVRGYPTDEGGDGQTALSGEQSATVDLYRRAHQTFESNLRGAASPDELRQGFGHYRTLATSLLDSGGPVPPADGPHE